MGRDGTLPLEGGADGMPVPEAGMPPSERYELLELLSRGGMGAVYRARDRRLDRIVAIKFMLGGDPSLTMRFLREARAQARIDHPNVCRVYEVGEIDGRVYIALQFVDGEPLHKAAGRMSLDQKVGLVRDVAMAIQEAHRLGIVHRDLKPANIMVEQTQDGRWFPVVVDFGLARAATTEAGLTRSGALVGTPAYMAPEQARGDHHAVDRRSDVYGLGATLYELLTGQPPFPTTSLALALTQVIEELPAAPRRLVPSVPGALETIALKCLAKDPAHRYPSARTLADDLGRYLDGEPILGRRPSLWRRVRLRARRQRGLVVLGAWSVVAVVAVAALGVRTWQVSRAERARNGEIATLARQLGEDAQDIDATLGRAYLLPLHDIRGERERVRERLQRIATWPHDLGELGDALLWYARGRGHLALHEWPEAARWLARAAAAGLDIPELHAARGLALGEQYRQAYDEARRSGEPGWVARQQQALEDEFLQPALNELERAAGAGDRSALLEIRLALYRRDFAFAEQRAVAVATLERWGPEARELAAAAAYGAAMNEFDRGNYEAALPALERAATLYAMASEAARSDASIHESEARAALMRAEALFRLGRPPREALEHAIDAIERAVRVDPDRATAFTTKAYVLLRWYRTPSLRGRGDQRELLDRIEQAAQRAVDIDPRDAGAWDALGNAHVARGVYEGYHGGEGTPWWSRSLDEFGRALDLRPNDPWGNNDLGVAHRWLGRSLYEAGRDPMPEYQAALRSYERAVAIDPQYVYAWSNQVDLHATIAEYESASGRDPRAAVARAERAGEQGLNVDENYYSVLNSLVQAQLVLASHLVDKGGDPTVALARARRYLERSEVVRAEQMTVWFYRLVAAQLEAKLRLREGGDPAAALVAARVALDQALRLGPDSAHVHVEAARLDLIEAESAARVGRAQAPLLVRARSRAENAIRLDPRLAEARLMAAQSCSRLGRLQRSRAIVEQGIAHVDQAVALNPQLSGAEAVRDELSRLRLR